MADFVARVGAQDRGGGGIPRPERRLPISLELLR